MKRCYLHFLCDESGSVATEYGLILTIISIITIGSIIAIGGSVNTFYLNASAGFSR